MSLERHGNLQDIGYIPLDGNGPGRRQTRFFYMIDALLRSRQAAGLETGGHRPDEDVNMYLTELLCRYAEHPRGQAQAEMLIPYESELAESIQAASDARAKYLIYRLNADHLLMTLGIFGNAWWRNPAQSAFAWSPTREESMRRGAWYYSRAAIYATRLEEGRRGLDELLDKLAVGFEDYIKILETLRGEYFHLLRSFSAGEWFHLCRDLGLPAD